MKIETVALREKAVLTAYLLDPSGEMPNMLVRPGILVLPGGGYRFCSDREAEPVAMAFLAQGFNAFVLRYSVGEGAAAAFPRPLEDAQQALALIRERAAEWNTLPQKIAAIGFSAGGHLAAALATMGTQRPDALILGYPCILASIGHVLSSPVPSVNEYVTAETPPTFIFASREDTSVPVEHSLAFATALERAGVPFELHVFGKGRHGFSLATPVVCSSRESLEANRFTAPWVSLCIAWLNELFGI